ncbi:NlpC/P60 family protein [Methyloligella sp. 2.7D]|uniref:C40 family peptidase n=1 Tax=unclassified Methyloligella TaxID=2625955 RepID=UPI00157BFDE1|nr:NlpC/P60 family protein [Methyloligella sp. GL2]QKP78579.1 C40 family peptidase [Methyloligella sp. GL2]
MSETTPDPRITPYREDLASEALRGIVEAPRYTEGTRVQVTASHLPLRRAPRADAPLETETLFGETLTLFDSREGWGWVQLDYDGYVGYLPTEGISAEVVPPTHRIKALRSYVYPEPNIKTPPLAQLSMNAQVSAKGDAGENGEFLSLSGGGFLFAGHAETLAEHEEDFVAVATRFLGTPYFWGGRTSLGLDCSGLVQLALQSAGTKAPRDTDLQMAALGETVGEGAPLSRGDLVFWRGHVGIMTSPETLLHANAHHMAVAAEPLEQAKARIAETGEPILAVKRLKKSA